MSFLKSYNENRAYYDGLVASKQATNVLISKDDQDERNKADSFVFFSDNKVFDNIRQKTIFVTNLELAKVQDEKNREYLALFQYPFPPADKTGEARIYNLLNERRDEIRYKYSLYHLGSAKVNDIAFLLQINPIILNLLSNINFMLRIPGIETWFYGLSMEFIRLINSVDKRSFILNFGVGRNPINISTNSRFNILFKDIGHMNKPVPVLLKDNDGKPFPHVIQDINRFKEEFLVHFGLKSHIDSNLTVNDIIIRLHNMNADLEHRYTSLKAQAV